MTCFCQECRSYIGKQDYRVHYEDRTFCNDECKKTWQLEYEGPGALQERRESWVSLDDFVYDSGLSPDEIKYNGEIITIADVEEVCDR